MSIYGKEHQSVQSPMVAKTHIYLFILNSLKHNNINYSYPQSH